MSVTDEIHTVSPWYKEMCETVVNDPRLSMFFSIVVESGRSRGRAEGAAKTITIFLEARFRKISKAMCDKIHGVDDEFLLNRIAEVSAKCESLDEFTRTFFSPAFCCP